MKILLTALLLTASSLLFADCTDASEYKYTSDELTRNIDPTDEWNVYCDSNPVYWNDEWNVYDDEIGVENPKKATIRKNTQRGNGYGTYQYGEYYAN